MELKIIWFLIVTVWTPNGITKFDLEYETKQDCVIAMRNTYLAQQRRNDGPRLWTLECREWSLPSKSPENPRIDT